MSRPCAVITTPSGTDAEMIAALAALGRNKAWGDVEKKQERLVTNIVVANGEVGTGTMAAAGMRHFSNITPAGKKVTANSLIQGVAQDAVEAVGLRFREDRSGIIALEKLESTIQKALQQAIDKEGRIAILHVMHVSKTGLNGPSAGFVSAMKKQYGDNLIVVVDAAHLRMDGSIASKWLDAGCWVMMTGSKFLGGASFSGVLLIPDHDADLLAQIEPQKIPAGLGDYFTPADCDRRFVHLRAALPNWYNVGLALRWLKLDVFMRLNHHIVIVALRRGRKVCATLFDYQKMHNSLMMLLAASLMKRLMN
ncbi:cysteine desulfurase [Candidatus Dependentiae bacterium]|nr:cysteine desulfurase [Candidatus Dependentiae bacterium]